MADFDEVELQVDLDDKSTGELEPLRERLLELDEDPERPWLWLGRKSRDALMKFEWPEKIHLRGSDKTRSKVQQSIREVAQEFPDLIAGAEINGTPVDLS